MRLTSFTDYSLRVLMYVALRSDRNVTVSEIARAFDISENHLMKVVHFLGKAGYLASRRGKNGGISLQRPADEIRLGQVVRATEAKTPIVECFDAHSNSCVIAPACQLKTALAAAVHAFNETLNQYTLADVTGNPQALAKLLQFEPARRNAA